MSDLEVWHDLLDQAADRVVRVVVLADSMGEKSFGFHNVWTALHRARTLASSGAWFPPRAFQGQLGWTCLPGEPAEIGIDGRGQLLRRGDGPAGLGHPTVVPTTLDLYYTACPDGAPIEVRVDGAVLAVVDSSRDESGRSVVGTVLAQRWRSPRLARMVTWELEVVGPGVAAVEVVCTPPTLGFEVHGTGHSGRPTRGVLDSGYALGHLDAMVARGEPPDLVLWAADTAEADPSVQGAALEEALDATRRKVPRAVLAHYVPTGRQGWEDSGERIAALRQIAEERGAVVLDGWKALGDLTPGSPGEGYADDGVHLNAEGQQAMDRAWIDTLSPWPLEPLAELRPWLSALSRSGERPVRVVLLADADGERSADLQRMWGEIHRQVADGPAGTWSSPGSAVAPGSWDLMAGRVVEAGLAGLGVELQQGDGPVGTTDRVEVPTTLDLFYTARPDGARLEVRVGGEATVLDTSLDEMGNRAEVPVRAQRWRSPLIASTVTWQLEVVGPGVVTVEGVSTPPVNGLDVHGRGSGVLSSRSVVDPGGALAHIEAMVARGEPPDLVLWAMGAAPSDDPLTEVLGTGDALHRIRVLLPGATIAQCVPLSRDGGDDQVGQIIRGIGQSVRAALIEVSDGGGSARAVAQALCS